MITALEKENKKLKARVKDLEGFLRWCIAEWGTVKDFLCALDPQISNKELRRIKTDNEISEIESDKMLSGFKNELSDSIINVKSWHQW